MSGISYMQAYVKCPYYNFDNGKNRIFCEGILPGSQTQHYFRVGKDFRLQMDLFCCNRYWNCEICEALDKKYEEEE